MIALPLYILDKTGSGSMMGIFAMLSMVPALVMSPFAGVLGDRWNRKKIMVNMDFAIGMVIYGLAFLAFTGKLTIPILFAGQVVISLMGSLFEASTRAMLPDLIDKEDFMRANSTQGAISSGSMILGPIIGGSIYGFGGVKMVFFINATSFVFSAASELFIIYAPKILKQGSLSAKVFIADIKEVMRFVLRHRGLMQLFGFVLVVNFVSTPMLVVVMPYVFRKIIGFTPQQFGYLNTFFTIGTLGGSVAIGVFLAKMNSSKLMKVGLIVTPIANVVSAMLVFPENIRFFGGASWRFLGILGLVLIFVGFFSTFVNTPIRTNLQKMVPGEMRSRFFSVLGVMSRLAVPVGTLITGFLLDMISWHIIMMFSSVLFLGFSIAFVLKADKEAYEPSELVPENE